MYCIASGPMNLALALKVQALAPDLRARVGPGH